MSKDLFYDHAVAVIREKEAQEELDKARQKHRELDRALYPAMKTLARTLLIDEKGDEMDGVIYWYGDKAILCWEGTLTLVPLISVNSSKMEEILAGIALEPEEEHPSDDIPF